MIEIIHRPYGQEHPYEQLPEERFPREPLAGQPFKIGIATRPPGAARQVTVHTHIAGQPGPASAAVNQPDWQAKQEDGYGAEFLERLVRVEQDIWHADLQTPDLGQTLEYWIEANGQQSEVFTWQPLEWQTSTAHPTPQAAGDTLSWHITPGESEHPAGEQPDWLPTLLNTEWLTDGQKATRVRLTFETPVDEAFFGLGERYNALNQRGNTLDVRCYDQFRYQGKRTYMPVPFLLSSRGYGLWVDSSRWMQFDLAESAPDRWTLEADLDPAETLTLRWLTGATPFEITGKFTGLTGKPALLPPWAFGLWMSANEWNSQQKVMAEVETTFAHEIIPSVLVIEAWSDETTFYIWNDATYTPRPGHENFNYDDFTFPPDGRWPDPKSMIDALHDRNIRVILWQIPTLKLPEPALESPQQPIDRDYFVAQGFGVKEPDGVTPYKIRPFWFREGYLWDVTNPAARQWWLNKRAYLLEELGIDGFKTDGGEHLWGSETVFADGRHGDELLNEYPRLYTEAYYNFTTEKRDGDALIFSRAGFTGSQVSPAHWAGDQPSTWNAFRTAILAGLSAGISGIPFWGLDIGGFSGPIPTAELYLRGTAMATFCPLMQYHSDYNQYREPAIFRTPWNMQERTEDARVLPTFRHFVNVRHNLMPYIWQEAQYAAQTGEPMMRALMLTDKNAAPYQYMFGRDLLVTPITEAEAEDWPVYLPPGQWTDLWTGEVQQGGQTMQVAVPLDHIPVFVRAGADIPLNLGPSAQLGEFVPFATTANATLPNPAP